MLQIAFVIFFGIFGVLSRYGILQFSLKIFPGSFLISTWSINSIGSFLIGGIYVLFAEKKILPSELSIGLMVGFLGGFTTFSAYSLEMLRLIKSQEYALLALYGIGSPVTGLAMAFVGFIVAHRLF